MYAMRKTTSVIALLGALVGTACSDRSSVGDRQAARNSFAPFELMDTDHNQVVNIEEWERAAERTAARLPKESAADFRCQLKILFRNLDANRDLQVSRLEWKTGKFEIHLETTDACSY